MQKQTKSEKRKTDAYLKFLAAGEEVPTPPWVEVIIGLVLIAALVAAGYFIFVFTR